MLWAPNSIDWVVAALATTYAGATLVPANSRYTAHEVAELVDRTSARLVVVADGFLDRTQIADLRAASDLAAVAEIIDVVDLPTITSEPTDIDDVAEGVSAEDVADILFTSGTTGRPKGAMSAHRQSIGVARAWAELGGVNADDRYLVVNPFFHSFGYKIGILVGLLTGATLYPVATFDVTATMRLIQDEQISLFPGAPTLYQSILAAPDRSDFDLSSLRLAVTGAAVVPVVLIERMRTPSPEGLGIDHVVTAFGMTEAVVVTMCREDDSAETVATTCGRAVPGMTTRIDAETGELLVRGDYVMLGYLDDPAATAEAIDTDGWLHTGDVGVLDDERQPAHHRPAQGHVHLRRLQRLSRRGGAGADADGGDPGRRRRGRPRRAAGRGRQGVRRGLDRLDRQGHRRRRDRVRQGAAGELQGAAVGGGHRRPPPQPVRQGAQDTS